MLSQEEVAMIESSSLNLNHKIIRSRAGRWDIDEREAVSCQHEFRVNRGQKLTGSRPFQAFPPRYAAS